MPRQQQSGGAAGERSPQRESGQPGGRPGGRPGEAPGEQSSPVRGERCPLRPLGDRLVVKRHEAVDRIGSIVLPDEARKRQSRGTVLAVGPGRWESGRRVPVEAEVGQVVIFAAYAGSDVPDAGEGILILREDEVLAVHDG